MNLHKASNNIISLDRPYKQARLRACCVNFRTVRKYTKKSTLRNWIKYQYDQCQLVLLIGLASITGVAGVMLNNYLYGGI